MASRLFDSRRSVSASEPQGSVRRDFRAPVRLKKNLRCREEESRGVSVLAKVTQRASSAQG